MQDNNRGVNTQQNEDSYHHVFGSFITARFFLIYKTNFTSEICCTQLFHSLKFIHALFLLIFLNRIAGVLHSQYLILGQHYRIKLYKKKSETLYAFIFRYIFEQQGISYYIKFLFSELTKHNRVLIILSTSKS